jgi:hypothetical protein
MESSNRLLLLVAALGSTLLLSGCALFRGDKQVEQQQTEEQAAAEESAEDADSTPPRVIEPNVARRKIKTPKIDNENWEIGAGFGFLSIEDFGTNSTYAGMLTYHVTEDFFFAAMGPNDGRPDQFREPGGDRNWPEMRGASRITASRWATTSCLARSFSVATPP